MDEVDHLEKGNQERQASHHNEVNLSTTAIQNTQVDRHRSQEHH